MRSWREARRAPSRSRPSCALSYRWRRILRAATAHGFELSIPTRRGKNASTDYVVLGHDSRLAQVVTNLIDNACSFSEPGGLVCVGLERISARSEPEQDQPFDRVVITVDDEGPGIPPHALERIFERFYTDRPSQGFGQNSGLGLSISRQIVEAHGGRIWACNRPAEPSGVPVVAVDGDDLEEAIRHGAGARFVVELPAFAA